LGLYHLALQIRPEVRRYFPAGQTQENIAQPAPPIRNWYERFPSAMPTLPSMTDESPGIEFTEPHHDRHAESLTKEGYTASHPCRAGHWWVASNVIKSRGPFCLGRQGSTSPPRTMIVTREAWRRKAIRRPTHAVRVIGRSPAMSLSQRDHSAWAAGDRDHRAAP